MKKSFDGSGYTLAPDVAGVKHYCRIPIWLLSVRAIHSHSCKRHFP
jgi:hypothetical protein